MLVFLTALCLALAISLVIVAVFQPPWSAMVLPLYDSSNLVPILWLVVLAGVVVAIQATRFCRERKQEAAEEQVWNAKRNNQSTDSAANFESVVEEVRAYREAKKRESERRYFGETITTLALVAAAAFAYFQWLTLDKTDKTLRDTLNSSDLERRAWLYTNFTQVSDLTFSDAEISTRFNFVLGNTGKLPGVNALIWAELSATPNRETLELVDLPDSCKSGNDKRLAYGVNVFPQQAVPYATVIVSTKERQQIPSGAINVFMVGCITYFSVGDAQVHRTPMRFIFNDLVKGFRLDKTMGAISSFSLGLVAIPIKIQPD
jgi:uncharacterized membrane protein